MEETKRFNAYTDFLHDKDFVLWILTGDDKLDRYWKKFLEEHPACTELFNRAVQHSANIKLNEAHLSDEEYESLRRRIHTSLNAIRKRRRRSRLVWWGTAVGVLLIGTLLYFMRSVEEEPLPIEEEPVAVLTEALDAKDIRFVHGESVLSFPGDIRLQMRRDGSAVVLRADDEEWIEKVEGERNELLVPYGKRSKVRLEDGTEVWLNSGSSLKFPARFTGKTREVTLAGEMYIEVAKDSLRPFIVHTDCFDIHVRGTKFDISAYEEEEVPYCVLIEGSVVVRPRWGTEMKLEENEKVVYRRQQLIKQKVQPSKYVCWKDGYLELDDTRLTDVLRQLERYYNLSFEYKNKAHLNGKKASGKIYLSENMGNVLSAISILYSVDFSFSNQDESP